MKNKKLKEEYKIYHNELDTDLKKWIKEKSEEIRKIYGLGELTLCFGEKCEKTNEHNGAMTVFSINFQKVYKTINLTIYEITKQLWQENKKDYLLNSLIHEFAHVLTTDLANAAYSRHIGKKEITDRIEELTESIAILARKLYDINHKK